MNIKAPVITIDGPSGSGKGTIAGILAKRLGWCLLDSGALYRLLAFAARNHGVDLTNEESLKLLNGNTVAVDELVFQRGCDMRNHQECKRQHQPAVQRAIPGRLPTHLSFGNNLNRVAV